MSKQFSLNKMRIIVIAVYIIFVAVMGAWCMNSYYAAQKALANFHAQKIRMLSLKTEINNTKGSIDSLKKELQEFRKLLFNDRDVPAFLDGLSHSAAKSSVYITDMKTERFAQIKVPKGMAGANNVENQRYFGDFEEDSNKDPSVEFKNRLTLAAMPIHIKIHGTFTSIIHFLNYVENYRQLLTISNVEITRNQDYPQLDCEFNLKIYSLENLKDITL
jgi:Tfp pilus assembly protein PilO